MTASVTLGGRVVSHADPVYVIAEIGINHNGDVELARRLVDAAVAAGCDAVKFQKRTPEICVPPHQRNLPRDTPWGAMTYLEYRERLELDAPDFATIVDHCATRGIAWLASSWDLASVDFVEQFAPVAHKIASACLTDSALLDRVAATGRPVILSTGMSTMEEIRAAVARLPLDRLLVAHSTSTYPCPPDTLNLRMLHTLREEFSCPIGYSGHEVGLPTTVAAVALGACFVERHITLDRSMWGTDQAASVEPGGFARLVRDIRVVQAAMGDGVKQVYDGEVPVRYRLRRVQRLMPTFSVIIPTYNRPEWLRAAVESVLAQEYTDFEVVVVDDGGTATLDLPDDPRVRALRQDVNTGLSGAMNTGIDAAWGDYVTFLDDDDLYTPRRLAMTVPALGRAGVVVCWSQVMGAPPQTQRAWEGNVYDTVLDTWAPPKGATVIARTHIPRFDVRYHALEDLDWWLNVSRDLDVTTVGEVGYLIRRHREPRNLNGPASRIRFGEMLLREHHDYFHSHRGAAALRWYSMGMIARQLGDYRFARRALWHSFRCRPTIKRLAHVVRSARRSTASWEDLDRG